MKPADSCPDSRSVSRALAIHEFNDTLSHGQPYVVSPDIQAYTLQGVKEGITCAMQLAFWVQHFQHL